MKKLIIIAAALAAVAGSAIVASQATAMPPAKCLPGMPGCE